MSLLRRNRCPHVDVTGIFGDAINHTPGHRRLWCRDCRMHLDGPVSIASQRQRALGSGEKGSPTTSARSSV